MPSCTMPTITLQASQMTATNFWLFVYNFFSSFNASLSFFTFQLRRSDYASIFVYFFCKIIELIILECGVEIKTIDYIILYYLRGCGQPMWLG